MNGSIALDGVRMASRVLGVAGTVGVFVTLAVGVLSFAASGSGGSKSTKMLVYILDDMPDAATTLGGVLADGIPGVDVRTFYTYTSLMVATGNPKFVILDGEIDIDDYTKGFSWTRAAEIHARFPKAIMIGWSDYHQGGVNAQAEFAKAGIRTVKGKSYDIAEWLKILK